MKVTTWLVILLVCLVSCQEKKGNNLPNGIKSGDVTGITLINKTPNSYIADTVNIKDEEKIADVLSEIQRLQPTKQDVATNVQFGFYIVVIHLKGNQANYYHVIYTVYDGVVIVNRGNNKLYKNDKIIDLLLRLMKK
ncbi:hypothetical protein [Mucilaginibacter ginsenosidivorax]|nr:hypothetical protein [Mucilaginibacter ginsenosidivorax]